MKTVREQRVAADGDEATPAAAALKEVPHAVRGAGLATVGGAIVLDEALKHERAVLERHEARSEAQQLDVLELRRRRLAVAVARLKLLRDSRALGLQPR